VFTKKKIMNMMDSDEVGGINMSPTISSFGVGDTMRKTDSFENKPAHDLPSMLIPLLKLADIAYGNSLNMIIILVGGPIVIYFL